MGRLAARAGRVLPWWGVRWVERRRARHRDLAGPIPSDALRALAPFFPAETLAIARVSVVPRIPLSGLLRLVRRMGISAVDVDRILGITYLDTILVRHGAGVPIPLPTLFHELVHVEQVRQLGTRGFVERYVRGWLESGRSYAAIPLEEDAYALERRFRAAPEEPFDVATEVARRIGGSSSSK
ncbi:MAG TPA: hypothetical protein VIE68_00430 [Gemmatimonadota bacterium]|jgi:hypothetical protein